jgi:peptide-methionine (S)-S-oxide reductase
MGGRADQATYRQVCNGDTGHVEVVRVTFDPDKISYRELLDVFFSVHDPTTLNRQGNDAGEQYRSVIFYSDEEQQRIAEDVIAEMTAAKVFPEPIVTAVEPAEEFPRGRRLPSELLQREFAPAVLHVRDLAEAGKTGKEVCRKIRA